MHETTEQLELFPVPEKLPVHTYVIPPNAKPATTCGSCGASIVFVTTPSGSNMPLALSTQREWNGQQVATSHYRDCPHASAWGKK